MTTTAKLFAAVALCAASACAMADRALLIGIDAYEGIEFRPLKGATNDARLLHGLLTDTLGYPPESIKLLTDKAATRQGILNAIDQWLVKGTTPGERVFIAYSGHGAQVADDNGDEADLKDEIIVPVDAYKSRYGLMNIIRDDELHLALAGLSDRRVTVVFDSCFSGTVTRSLLDGVLPDGVRTISPHLLVPDRAEAAGSRGDLARREDGVFPRGDNITVWTAVSDYQLALETIEDKHYYGFFTHSFVDEVRRALKPGGKPMSHVALHNRLIERSIAHCDQVNRNTPFGKRSQCEAGLSPTVEVARNLLPTPISTTLLGTDVPSQGTFDTAAEVLTPPASNAVSDRIGLTILPSNRHRAGDEMRFEISSTIDGHLMVFDIDAEGALIQLFPNSHSEKRDIGSKIKAGERVRIPTDDYGFALSAGPPYGQGHVVAVVTADRIDLDDLVVASRGISRAGIVPMPTVEAKAFLAELGERLRQIWPGDWDEADRHARWGFAVAEYSISPR